MTERVERMIGIERLGSNGGLGIVLTDGPGVDVVAAVKGVSACSGGNRLVILTPPPKFEYQPSSVDL